MVSPTSTINNSTNRFTIFFTSNSYFIIFIRCSQPFKGGQFMHVGSFALRKGGAFVRYLDTCYAFRD